MDNDQTSNESTKPAQQQFAGALLDTDNQLVAVLHTDLRAAQRAGYRVILEMAGDDLVIRLPGWDFYVNERNRKILRTPGQRSRTAPKPTEDLPLQPVTAKVEQVFE